MKKWICCILLILSTDALSSPASSAIKPHYLAFFVGHSQWRKGAQGINSLPREWDYCQEVAEEVVKLSKQYNVIVEIFYRGPYKYRKAIRRMYKRKNKWNVSASVISCHYNITPQRLKDAQMHALKLRALFTKKKIPKKGYLVGTMILTKPTANSLSAAKRLLHNVRTLFKRNNKKYINVSEIVPVIAEDRGSAMVLAPYSKSPNLLLEIGYGDNQLDSKTMLKANFKKQLAIAILKSLKE